MIIGDQDTFHAKCSCFDRRRFEYRKPMAISERDGRPTDLVLGDARRLS
ncbi:hypothetical protein ACVWWG_006182 [Bradyrhizobium sp. LB7.2]